MPPRIDEKKPRPPGELVEALQDNVTPAHGPARAARSTKLDYQRRPRPPRVLVTWKPCSACGVPTSHHNARCPGCETGYLAALADVASWLRAMYPGQLCSVPGAIERGDADGFASRKGTPCQPR
jgi:hypothetical protein